MSGKSGSSDALNTLPLNFKIGVEIHSENEALQEFLTKLDEFELDADIKPVIKKILNFYQETEKNANLHLEIGRVIIDLFSRFNNRRSLKKHLQETLKSQDLLYNLIKSTAEYLLQEIKKDKTCNLKMCNEFLHFISILQTGPEYDYEENFRPLFPLYMALFDGFAIYASQIKQDIVPEIEELNVLMNAVLKQILPIFVKNVQKYLEEVKQPYLQSLLMYSYILLFNHKIGFDLRMKVCLVFVYTFNVLEGETTNVSQLISKNSSPFNLSINRDDEGDTPEDYYIIIYSSIINVLPENQLISETVDGKSLLYVLYEGILDTAKKNPGHNAIIIEVSKSLCNVAKHLTKIPVELLEPIFLEGLFYIASHVNHHIDAVRNYTKIFFEYLVTLARIHHFKKYELLTEILIGKIQELPNESTMKYYAYEFIAKCYGCEFLLRQFENLPFQLLHAADSSPTINEQICKVYQFLVEKGFNKSSTEAENNWVRTWVVPAIKTLKSGAQNEHFCQKVIICAFKLEPVILRMIFPNDYIGTEAESKVLLHCLHNARKNGKELSVERDHNLYWRGLIDKQKMDMFMIHQNDEIRILVLATITDSLKSTELFLDWEFFFLTNFIRYNITAQSANIRKQIIGYYKKVFTRYEAGLKVIDRNLTKLRWSLDQSPDDKNLKKINLLYTVLKKSYKQFVCNITRVLIGNLSCDSNFPRRATSLELLITIREVLLPEDWKSYWSEDDIKDSHNILFDTYENNKKMIVDILKSLPAHCLGFTNVGFTFKYMQRSLKLALDVKPSKTLSAAYLFDICSYSPFFYDIVSSEHGEESKRKDAPTLDMIVLLTRKFINEISEIKIENIPIAKKAVYGLILSIRHLLESRNLDLHNGNYAAVFDHLVTTCLKFSEKIMPIVCNPSPEGFLPENVEEMCVSDESPKAQKLMVYAWRTMRETTLLLAEIVKQCIKVEYQILMLPDEIIIKIGRFFVDIFIQSKHRGVFEQAYVGFSIICDYFTRSIRGNINCLPKKWLEEAVELCTGVKYSEDLCATRRSAGLPFLILSILTTYNDPNCFQFTMSNLLNCAENEENNDETRMHCFNVLRAIFRHSKLGENVTSYLSRGVILAINGFKSKSWIVRNSSTLLFSAVVTRMFGVQRTTDSDQLCIKNKLSVKVFYLRYQELYEFMLNQLAEECYNEKSLILQHILTILSRLYPSYFEEGSFHKIAEYLPHIEVCLKNSEYRTREAAAKASVALISPKDVKEHFDKCFRKISNSLIKDNECHGLLLQMYYIYSNFPTKGLPLSDYFRLSTQIWKNPNKSFSPMTVSRYIQLVTIFLYNDTEYQDVLWLRKILVYLSKYVRRTRQLFWMVNFNLVRIILAHFIIMNKLEETDSTYLTISNEILSILYGPHSVMKKYCLQLLIALNQKHLINGQINKECCNEGESNLSPTHPLFITKELELNPDILELVKCFPRPSIQKLLRQIHPYIRVFLVEEMKTEHYIKKEDRVYLFILFEYFPCTINYFKFSKQEILNILLNNCDSRHEDLTTAVICYISTFLNVMDYNCLDFDELINILKESASPAAALHSRLAVSGFLCQNHALFCNEEPVLRGQQLCAVFNIAMVLLEDEDVDVRNSMSNFENSLKVRIKVDNYLNQIVPGNRWPVVAEKAKEDLIYLMTVLLPQDLAICLIFSWACRYFPDPYNEAGEEVFEKGGLNQHAENTPIIDVCTRVLIKMLWPLPDGHTYEDRTIFIEEQTQFVTGVLLSALTKYESPMMISKTKMSVICSLKSLYKFLENAEVSCTFRTTFRTYFNDTILSYMTNRLEHNELFCVKTVFKKLYDPVFRLNRR